MITVGRRSPPYKKRNSLLLPLNDSSDELCTDNEKVHCRRMGECSRTVTQDQWEVGKLLFIFVFFILSSASNWAALAYIHDIAGREPLPDIIFTFIPEIPQAAKLGDTMVNLNLLCCFLLLIFHQSNLIIIRRSFFIISTLYSMRSVSLLATQLPPSFTDISQHCRERTNFSLKSFMERILDQANKMGVQEGDHMLCGDLLFSGHSIIMMICMLTITHYYLPKKFRILRVFPCCFAYLGMTCMIVSRGHYTIDVVIAHWLSTLMFTSYHSYAELEPKDRRESVLHKYTYFRVIAWLEENITPGK